MNDILLKRRIKKDAYTRKGNLETRQRDGGWGRNPTGARERSEACERVVAAWFVKNTIVEILWRQNLCVSLWYKKQFVKIVLFAQLRC